MTVPVLVWTMIAATGGLKALELGLQAIMLALYVYVLIAFRALLHERFQFHGVDTAIQALIGLAVLSLVLEALGGSGADRESVLSFVGLAALVANGVVSVVYAVRLLRLPGDLFGLLRPFCYATITAGAGLALVVLLPLGLLAGIIADVFLGMILLRAASD